MWDNTKHDLKYTEREIVELINLVHDKDQWRFFNAVRGLGVTLSATDLVTRWAGIIPLIKRVINNQLNPRCGGRLPEIFFTEFCAVALDSAIAKPSSWKQRDLAVQEYAVCKGDCYSGNSGRLFCCYCYTPTENANHCVASKWAVRK